MWLWLDSGRARWLQKAATRCVDADRRWTISLQRAVGKQTVLMLMLAVSWLGDGPVWYALIVGLPLVDGWGAWPCALQMLCLGTINLLIYYCLKHGIGRQRPYVDCPDIRACARALDRFSFPSGHMLHAVAYSMIVSAHYPAFSPFLWVFVVLVAASRVTLGLHYPSDVVVGGAVGALTASIILAWP